MVVVAFLIALALALFWILPLGAAIVGAMVAALLVAAKLHDAVRHGRLVMAARKQAEDADSDVQDRYQRNAIFHAMWIGLTVSHSSYHHNADAYVHGQPGTDYGGDTGGGFGDGGGV